MDEQGFTVLGGQAESISETAREGYRADLDRAGAIKLGAKVLAADGEPLAASQLEVALLDRTRARRAFQRIRGDELDGAAAADSRLTEHLSASTPEESSWPRPRTRLRVLTAALVLSLAIVALVAAPAGALSDPEEWGDTFCTETGNWLPGATEGAEQLSTAGRGPEPHRGRRQGADRRLRLHRRRRHEVVRLRP